MADVVVFKGIKSGLELHIDGSHDFLTIEEFLKRKLATSTAFFNAGMEVTVICQERELSPDAISSLNYLLTSNGLILGDVLRSPVDENIEKQKPKEKVIEVPKERVDVEPIPQVDLLTLSSENDVIWESPEVEPEEEIFVYKKTLRNGQVLSHPCSVMILGDINPGAEVMSGKNIIIKGICRGIVHAGVPKNHDAMIMADKLLATQIRIADVIARSPDHREMPQFAEKARLEDGKIVIEKYEDSGKE